MTDLAAPPTALVTGAAKRVGAAIARQLAQEGVAIAIHYQDSKAEAEALRDEISSYGNQCVTIQGDLTDSADIKRLFEQARSTLGPINLLVNNASVFENDKIEDLNEAQWDLHFDLHVKAPSLLASHFAGQDDLSDGLIVNLVDQRVWRLTPNFYSYTLSKSALWTATKTMAQALAPRIRVNGIGPGPTLPNSRQSQDDFDQQVEGLLLKRSPDLNEFGKTIIWLWQAKSVTGQMIALDGGQHLAWETPDVKGVQE